MLRGDVAQLEEHLLCKQGVVGSSPIISTKRYSYIMDKKDFKDLSEIELRELKESIEDLLEEKKFKGRYLKTNQRGIGIAWFIIAIIISAFRYFTL